MSWAQRLSAAACVVLTAAVPEREHVRAEQHEALPPLVPHLGFMSYFSFNPPLMTGWVTHGVDFYCDDATLPCPKEDTAFGTQINASQAAWRRYRIPSLYPSLASVDGLMVRGVGLRQGWEDVLDNVMRAEILPNYVRAKSPFRLLLAAELRSRSSRQRSSRGFLSSARSSSAHERELLRRGRTDFCAACSWATRSAAAPRPRRAGRRATPRSRARSGSISVRTPSSTPT